jgi:hypothetical protein
VALSDPFHFPDLPLSHGKGYFLMLEFATLKMIAGCHRERLMG